MQIETPRLLLRPFAPGDAGDIAAFYLIPGLWDLAAMPPQTRETCDAFVGYYANLVQPAAEPGMKGDWVFAAHLRVREAQHRQGDVGYCLHPDFWGRGLATEAVRALLDLGFGTLELERIFALTIVENVASWRLMERIGMTREGIMRHNRLVSGAWRDSVLYAILRGEFRSGGSARPKD
jgi:RimJ/RimL family protein N-acetyltransferase